METFGRMKLGKRENPDKNPKNPGIVHYTDPLEKPRLEAGTPGRTDERLKPDDLFSIYFRDFLSWWNDLSADKVFASIANYKHDMNEIFYDVGKGHRPTCIGCRYRVVPSFLFQKLTY